MSDEIQPKQTDFDHLDTVYSVISIQLVSYAAKIFPGDK